MKLPKGYVVGQGVPKASGFGGVGQRMLEQLGWQEGQGLGKDRSGMREALEVKEKKDQLGVGATGPSWDWAHNFWEQAYNSTAKAIQLGSGSSSSSSSSSDSSDTSDATGRGRARGRGAGSALNKPGSQPRAALAAVLPPSNHDSDSDSEQVAAGGGLLAAGGGVPGGAALHRDGTLARGASAAELGIAAALSRDPWGRWGGRAGKMARIRQQEEAAAAAARVKLEGGSQQAAPPASAPASEAAPPAGLCQGCGRGPRLVVTLDLAEDEAQRIKRLAFVATPRTGWWGASYWVSAGPLEGVEQQEGQRCRQTFNEDDQAALYMQAHAHKRQGLRGLGKSSTLKVAGGQWQGSRTTFDEEGEQQGQAGQQPGGQQQGSQPAVSMEQQGVLDSLGQQGGGSAGGEGQPLQDQGDQVAAQQRAGRKAARSKADAKAGKCCVVGPTREGVGQEAGGGGSEAAGAAARGGEGKKGRKRKPCGSGQGGLAAAGGEAAGCEQAGQHSCVGSGASAGVQGEVVPGVQVGSGAAAEVQGTVRWLKVARAALKQAPGSRLKVKALCRQLLQQVQERHSGPGGVTLTRAHVAAVLQRKAAANKLVMSSDGFVSLPLPRVMA